MAIGIGTILASGFFARNKKKLWIGLAVVIVGGAIYGGMKYDAWKIMGLKEDLQTERQANVKNKETIEETDRLSRIDEEAVMSLLDNRDDIRQETDEKIAQVVNDVRLILEQERSARQEELASLGDRLEKDTDEPSSERVIHTSTVREVDRGVSPRVAERLVDGMWDAYCDGVPDDRVCAERQSVAQSPARSTAE